MARPDLTPDEVLATVGAAVAAARAGYQQARPPARRTGSGAASSVLPDAAAVAVGAYACHRAGLTGQGVRIGLSDSGIGASEYFSARSYRVEGDRADRDGHGTGMAAILLAIAPDATVLSYLAGGAALGTLLRCADVDVVLCAWGSYAADPGIRFDRDRPVIAADPGSPDRWPATEPMVAAVGGGGPWPTGPYTLPGGRHSWSGASVAAATCCAVVALAVGGGVDPGVAVQLAAPVNASTGS